MDSQWYINVMEKRDAPKVWKWMWPYTEFHTYQYMHIHVFWTVCIVSECETEHQTGYSKLGLWSSLKMLVAHQPCNRLLAASTHAPASHWPSLMPAHTSFSLLSWCSGPRWCVVQMQSLQNASSDSLCSEVSSSCILADSRKSSKNSWVKIRECADIFRHCFQF